MSLDGLRIHYKHQVNPEATTTIVMLHGVSGNTSNFTNVPMWNDFSSRFSLLAFDRPGWGLSPRVLRTTKMTGSSWPTDSGENPYTYEYSTKLLLNLLEYLELSNRPKILLAHSHGGEQACVKKSD